MVLLTSRNVSIAPIRGLARIVHGESEVWEATQQRHTSIAKVFFNRGVLARYGFLTLGHGACADTALPAQSFALLALGAFIS